MFLKLLISSSLLGLALHASSPPLPKDTPLDELDGLIASTEDLVAKQKKLRALLSNYLQLHDQYLLDIDNREQLIKTARIANQALDMIKADHLAYLFEPTFISEMTLFARLAARPSIPKPE